MCEYRVGRARDGEADVAVLAGPEVDRSRRDEVVLVRDERVVLSFASELLLRCVWDAPPLGAAREADTSGWGLHSRLAWWRCLEVKERDGAGGCERGWPELLQLRRVTEAPESSCRRCVVCCLAAQYASTLRNERSTTHFGV